MAPLSEVHNQARPARRPAVYGRKKGVNAQTREMHRQLFGTDENDIAKDFEKLTIDAEPQTISQSSGQTQSEPATELPVKSNSASEHKPATKSRLQPDSASDVKLESNAAHKPKATRQKRRQPTRTRRAREMAVKSCTSPD
jgi:hypothetical protein